MTSSCSTPSLIVALPQLQDPNFLKSVVLMVESNEKGSMGYIINRPASYSVRDVLPDGEPDIPPNIPAWFGGPVGMDRGVVIHNRPDEQASNKLGLIRVSSSPIAMESLVECHQEAEKQAAIYSSRFVVGYAGWGPRQLEREMKAGAWIQVDAGFDLIFNTPWQDMWDQAMKRIGVNPMNIAPTVQPFLN